MLRRGEGYPQLLGEARGDPLQRARVADFCEADRDATEANRDFWKTESSKTQTLLQNWHPCVPISLACEKQTTVSHSTEAEVGSLDTDLRLEGSPALTLWDIVIDVLEPHASRIQVDHSAPIEIPNLTNYTGNR